MLWLGELDHIYRVREHGALVSVALMLATNRERLTRRSARNEFNAPLPLREIHCADVRVDHTKLRVHPPVPVLAESIAGVPVTLNDHYRGKS